MYAICILFVRMTRVGIRTNVIRGTHVDMVPTVLTQSAASRKFVFKSTKLVLY